MDVLFIFLSKGGNWGKGHPIPDDSAGLDTFEQLRENLNLVMRELLEKPVDLEVDTSKAVVKVKHVYKSCMDLGLTIVLNKHFNLI